MSNQDRAPCVCMVCGYRPTPSGGGTEKYVYELCLGLLERGLQVEIACEDRSYLPDEENPLAGHVRGIAPMPHIESLVDAFREKSRRLSDAIDFSRYDVIHSHGQFGFEPFFHANRLRHRPALVSTFHLTALGPVARYQDLGLPDPREAAVDRATSLMEEVLARLSDRCIAVSEGVAAELINLYRTDAGAVTTVLNWFDPGTFYPRDRGASRHELRMSPEGSYVLYVGHFNMSRGDILKDALRALPPGVIMLVLHHDTDPAVQAEFGDRVEFRGHVSADGMARYYSAVDLLCFPALYAGFGLVLTEAMACGCPCVVFDYPAMNEVVTAASGYLVQEPTGRALAAAIAQGLADGSQKSVAARERAELFRKRDQVDRMIDVYRDALAVAR